MTNAGEKPRRRSGKWPRFQQECTGFSKPLNMEIGQGLKQIRGQVLIS